MKRCITQRFLILVLFVATVSQPVIADVITFRVIDAETGEPIEGAIYGAELKWENGMGRQSGYETDSLGRGELEFGTDCPRVTLQVECPGYYSAKRVFSISDGKDTLALGDIALKPYELLQKAVVTARAKRFTMRGDTVVFNPAAFRLEEGARLEDLLKKLPGVQFKDGELFWNNKPVRILVEGQESLSGELLRQLPAEAVDKIKGYNKRSEAARKTQRDDGSEDMVLDLKIKEGWLDKWYAGIEAKGQTPRHALAKLDATRLATKEQAMAFAEWNNVGKRFGRQVQQSSESKYDNGRQTYGAGGYYRMWMMPRAKGEDRSTFTINGHLDHFDFPQWHSSVTEVFFPDETFLRSIATNRSYSHSLQPNIVGRVELRPDSANTFTLNFGGNLQRGNTYNDGSLERTDEEGNLVLKQKQHSTSSSQRLSGNVRASWYHYFADKSNFGLTAVANYNHTDDEGTTQRTINYAAAPSSSVVQTFTQPSHNMSLDLGASYERWIGENIQFGANYNFRHDNAHSRQLMSEGIAPESLAEDRANSFRRRDDTNTHSFSLSSTINLKPFQILPNVNIAYYSEHLNYQRGSLDTTATRNSLIVAPLLKTVLKFNKQRRLELTTSYSTSLPDLLETLAYIDSSDPINIRKGNPNLRSSGAFKANVLYTANVVKQQRVFSAKAGFTRNILPVQTLRTYDVKTSAYTTTSANVRGGNTYSCALTFDQGRGEKWRVYTALSADFGTRNAYLTDTGSGYVLNHQRFLSLNLQPEVFYERETWQTSLYATVNHSRQHNNATDNYALWDYTLGLRVRIKLGDFELKTDFRDEAHRGYTSAEYDRDRFLWNAAIGWTCLKGKGRIELSADDILNQNTPYYSRVDAFQRYEVHWEKLHHFVALTFAYRLEPKGNNK